MQRWLVLALGASLALAGCLDLGGGEDGDDDPRSPTTGPGSSPGSGGSASPSQPRPRPPPPPVPTTLELGGTGCTRLGVTTTADLAAVRAWVPETYAFKLAESGRVLMVLTVVTCESVLVPGREPTPAALSELSFVIEAPDGSGGDHLYRLWTVGDNLAMASSLQRFGLIAGYVLGVELSTTSPAPLVVAAATGTVPWAGLPYFVNATLGGPGAPDVERAETSWFESARGPIKITTTYQGGQASSVVGEVSAKPGSVLATFMGAPTQPATGTLDTRDLTWFVERVAP